MKFNFVYRMMILCLPPFFLSANPVEETSKKEDIEIVYHIATLGNWEEVVTEQVELLNKSGLGEACDNLTVTVVGSGIEKVYQHFSSLSFYNKVSIIHDSEDLHRYEFPGIERVIKIALDKPNARILYIHTKGVSYYGEGREQPSKYWRRYMEYFTIEQWRDCIQALKDANICGVDWTLSTSGLPFFAGNFWWGRGEYISTCCLNYTSRFACEAFIGTGRQPIAKTFHQSGENPRLMNFYTYANFPHFFHFDPKVPFHQGIMNLYAFCYLEEFYIKQD